MAIECIGASGGADRKPTIDEIAADIYDAAKAQALGNRFITLVVADDGAYRVCHSGGFNINELIGVLTRAAMTYDRTYAKPSELTNVNEPVASKYDIIDDTRLVVIGTGRGSSQNYGPGGGAPGTKPVSAKGTNGK